MATCQYGCNFIVQFSLGLLRVFKFKVIFKFILIKLIKENIWPPDSYIVEIYKNLITKIRALFEAILAEDF